jgi:hypothetical protein
MWQKDQADPSGEHTAPMKHRALWTSLVVLLGALLLWHLNRWAHGVENSYHFLAYTALLLVNTHWFASLRWRAPILGLGALVLILNEIRLLL